MAQVMAKAELSPARLYADQVEDREVAERIYGLIDDEFERTKQVYFRIFAATAPVTRPSSYLRRSRSP